jgi:hypothetical protein
MATGPSLAEGEESSPHRQKIRTILPPRPGRFRLEEKTFPFHVRAVELHHGMERYSKTMRKIAATNDLNRQKNQNVPPNRFSIDRNKPIGTSFASPEQRLPAPSP